MLVPIPTKDVIAELIADKHRDTVRREIVFVLSRELPLVSAREGSIMRLLWGLNAQISIHLPLLELLLLELRMEHSVYIHTPDASSTEFEPKGLSTLVHIEDVLL